MGGARDDGNGGRVLKWMHCTLVEVDGLGPVCFGQSAAS